MASTGRHYVLFYEYVDGIAERRAPHRAAHLAHLERWRDDGRLVLGGAIGDPLHGGLLVFRVEDPAEIEAFVADDPYAQNGLVVSHRTEPWNVAVA